MDLFDLFAKISIDTSEYDRGLDDASKKFQEIGKTISDAGGVLTKGVTLPLVGAGTAAGKMSLDFEDAIAKVSTIADLSQVPLGDLESAILSLSNQTGISSNEIANNVYDAISAGQKTGDAVNFVGNSTKLAKAGFAEAGDALDILTTILNAYGLEADQVSQVSDMLIQTQNLGKTTVGELATAMGKVIPTAKAQGVELDNLSSAYAVMTSNGVATAETTTYLNSMLNELGKQGTTAAKAFAEGTAHIQEGGLTMAEAMERGWELTDVLSILSESAEMSGTSIANMFSSAEAGKAAAVLWDNAEKFNAALEEMRNSSGATEIAFEKLQTKSVLIEKAINQLKNALINLGGTLMDVLAPLIEQAAEAIAGFVEWFSNLSDGAKELIVVIGMVAAAAGPVLIGIGKVVSAVSAIGSAIGGLIGMIGNAGTAISGLFAILAANPIAAVIAAVAALTAGIIVLWNTNEDFRNAVGAIWDAITGFFVSAWDTIQAAWTGAAAFFQGVWDAISSVFSGVTAFFSEIFSAAWQAVQTVWSVAVEFFSGVVDGIKGAFDGIGEFLGELFTIAWELITATWNLAVDFFTTIADGIRAVFEAVTGFLGDAFSAAWEVVSGAWGAAVDFFAGIWSSISSAGKTAAEAVGNALKRAWDAVKSAWDGAVDFFSGIYKGIVGAFDGILDRFLGIGGNIVKGLRDGVTGAWGGFMDWLNGKIGGIVNGVKAMLGIHSPSTVFAGIGENMALGLAEGWDGQYGSIKRSIEGGLRFSPGPVDLDYSPWDPRAPRNGPQSAAGGGSTFHFTFNSPKALNPVEAAREARKASQQIALLYV